ncbi:hypothetical protein CPC08DRAFT_710480 [Agrocybe pediades]|nr:hypothetical protein CPC08DRAFT_710480 [Agrocybe pediades]
MACIYFQRGSCVFGAGCKKSHDPKFRAASSVNSRDSNDGCISPSTPAIDFNPNDETYSNAHSEKNIPRLDTSESPDHASPPIARTDSSIPFCIFDAQKLCNRGDKCEFLHAGREAAISQLNDNATSPNARAEAKAPVTSISASHTASPSAAFDGPDKFQWSDKGQTDLAQGDKFDARIAPHVHEQQQVIDTFSGNVDQHLEPTFLPQRSPPQHPSPRVKNTRQVTSAGLYPHISEVTVHWSQYADPMANKGVPFCKLHAQGKCLSDESCRFRHSLTPDEYTLLFHDQQPNLWTSKRDQDFFIRDDHAQHIVERKPFEPPLHSVVVDAPTPAAPSISCTFYPLGKCRNGTHCPYRHIGPVLVESTKPMATGLGKSAAANSEGDTAKRQPCKFFISKGFCQKGDICKFAHESSSATSHSSAIASGVQHPSEPESSQDENSGWSATAWDQWSPSDATDPSLVPTHVNNGWDSTPNPEAWGIFGDTTSATTNAGNIDSWNVKPETERIVGSQLEELHATSKDCDDHHVTEEGSSPTVAQPTPSADKTPAETYNGEYDDINASSWLQPWPVDSPAPEGPRKINAYCKAFGQGYCRYGDQCRYLHDEEKPGWESEASPVPQSEGPVETPSICNAQATAPTVCDTIPYLASQERGQSPIAFDHPIVIRPIMQCEVSFREDLTPEDVRTTMDSQKLVISNLPLDASPSELSRTLAEYGNIRGMVSTDESEDSSTVEVQFDDYDSALKACRHINCQMYESRAMVATLDSRSLVTFKDSNECLNFKITWPNPRVQAWSFYKTITQAKAEAVLLNGIIFLGRTIEATFISPKKSAKTERFAIKIDMLPPDVTQAQVEELCKDSSIVTITPPTYNGDPLGSITSTLSEYGAQGLELLPDSKTRHQTVAFATCQNLPILNTLIESLHSRPQAFLGDQPLSIRRVFYNRYRIIRQQYEAIRSELERLKEQLENKCTIQETEHPHDKTIIHIRIWALFENRSPFSEAIAKLSLLICGATLKDDNHQTIWDEYFEGPSGEKALKQLKLDAYVFYDNRTKQVKIFGSPIDQEDASKRIMRLLSKVRSQRQKLDIPRSIIHALSSGPLANLQAEIGIQKVSLDVVKSQLTVRGGPEDVSKARAALDSLSSVLSDFQAVDRPCQICLRIPQDALMLSCRHQYCTTCLKTAICQMGDAPFQCISRQPSPDITESPRCPAYVPYVMVHDILSSEEGELLRKSLLAHVYERPDRYLFCPSLTCKAIYRVGEKGTHVKCCLCLSDICTFCKTFAHPSLSCKVEAQ